MWRMGCCKLAPPCSTSTKGTAISAESARRPARPGALGSFDPQRDKLGVAVVQKDRCIAYFEGCVECEKACPYEAIALDDVGHPVIDAAKCNGCGVCENVCPALVYRSFAGGSRRGVVVVAPERYERLGRTTVEGESEMIV